jgi:hypothetical protein
MRSTPPFLTRSSRFSGEVNFTVSSPETTSLTKTNFSNPCHDYENDSAHANEIKTTVAGSLERAFNAPDSAGRRTNHRAYLRER